MRLPSRVYSARPHQKISLHLTRISVIVCLPTFPSPLMDTSTTATSLLELLTLLRASGVSGGTEHFLLGKAPKIYRIIRKDKYEDAASFVQALKKDEETLTKLEHQDENLGTPLLYALVRRSVPVWKAKVLLDLGANPNAPCSLKSMRFKYAVTPMMAALLLPQLSTAKLLLKYGASFDTTTLVKMRAFTACFGDRRTEFDSEKVLMNPIATMVVHSLSDSYSEDGYGFKSDKDPSIRVAWVLDHAPRELVESWDLTRLGSNRGILTAAVCNEWFGLATKLISMEQVDLKFIDPSVKLDVLGIACNQDHSDFVELLMSIPETRRSKPDTVMPNGTPLKMAGLNTRLVLEAHALLDKDDNSGASTLATTSTASNADH